MEEKKNAILAAEEYFARRVVLRAIVKRPVKPWLQIIPGMFIFDFLRRQRETRLYSEYYVYPRKQALNAAVGEGGDFESEDRFSAIRVETISWLKAQKINSPRVLDATMNLIHVLSEHYAGLLRVEGTRYDDLVSHAYRDRDTYEDFLKLLNTVEDDMDTAIMEKFSQSEEVHRDLLLKREERHYLRNLDTDSIFPR